MSFTSTSLETQPSFGARIAQLRKKQRITLKNLKQKTDLSESHISRLESGERQPSRDVVLKLAQAFFPQDRGEELDELLILAGFSPCDPERLKLPKDRIAIYEQELEKNGTDFKIYEILIVTLIKAGRYDEAQAKIQEGFQLFSDAVQLQALLAKTEMAKGHYRQAILSQQLAIDYYFLQPKKERRPENLVSLLLSLGVIFFLAGDKHLNQQIEALDQGRFKKAAAEKAEALKYLNKGREQFAKALAIAPQDVYILDEYARINFSLALVDFENQDHLWQESIASFKQVLKSKDKQSLGYPALLETGVFLAHAYTKCQRFEEAEDCLDLIMAYVPHHWLVHYAKACLYSLKYARQEEPDLLAEALDSLKRAVKAPNPKNRACQEAMLDPDLQMLRKLRKSEFTRLVKGEEQ